MTLGSSINRTSCPPATTDAEVRGHPGCQASELLVMRSASLVAFGALSIGIVIGAGYTRSAISPAVALPCHGSARAMVRLELLFGTARPERPPVSDQEWASFLDTEVTPRFPAGLTVLRGPGQWRGSDGPGEGAIQHAGNLARANPPNRRRNRGHTVCLQAKVRSGERDARRQRLMRLVLKPNRRSEERLDHLSAVNVGAPGLTGLTRSWARARRRMVLS